MMRMLIIVLCLVRTAGAAERIEVSPEPGAIAAAIGRAGPGDTIALAPGTFTDVIHLPDGVTLEGAGANETTIVVSEFAAIHSGDRSIIREVEIRSLGECRRGVAGDGSMRVERCRFVEVPEAVAMRMAPLSDVVDCEFVDCEIGVRAIGEASPTISRCVFRGGRIGVFAMGGSPYMVNNLFVGVERGTLVVGEQMQPAQIRNSVYVGCTGAAVAAESDAWLPIARLVNCVFVRCEKVLAGSNAGRVAMAECAVDECGDAAFDHPAPDKRADEILRVQLGLRVGDDGHVTMEHSDALEGKGLPRPFADEDEVVCVGLMPRVPGEGMPVRFDPDRLVANCTSEQYMYMRLRGFRMSMQSVTVREGIPYDIHQGTLGGEESTLEFDVSRYYGQS